MFICDECGLSSPLGSPRLETPTSGWSTSPLAICVRCWPDNSRAVAWQAQQTALDAGLFRSWIHHVGDSGPSLNLRPGFYLSRL